LSLALISLATSLAAPLSPTFRDVRLLLWATNTHQGFPGYSDNRPPLTGMDTFRRAI